MAGEQVEFNAKKIDNAREQVSLEETRDKFRQMMDDQRSLKTFSNHLETRMEVEGIWNLIKDLREEGNGKLDTSDLETVGINTENKVAEINESVQSLLNSNINTWIPVIGTPEYQQLKDNVTTIYNNVKLGVPDILTTYSMWTVYNNGNVKILTMQDPMDSSKNVKITFNKWQNRLTVTKDWNFISSKVYM